MKLRWVLLNAPLSSATQLSWTRAADVATNTALADPLTIYRILYYFKFHSDLPRVTRTPRESSRHHSIIQYFQATHRYMQTALLPLHRFKVTNPRVLPQITYFYVHIGPKITNLVQPFGHSPDPEVQRASRRFFAAIGHPKQSIKTLPWQHSF